MLMQMRVWRRTAALLVSAAAAACASPRDTPRPADTLLVAAPSPTPAAAPAPARPADTSAYTLRAFVGSTAASPGSALPELALVAPDGRRVGWDPASRRAASQLPGADYDSVRSTVDDEGSGGDASGGELESRIVRAPVRANERYVLAVAASDSGTFVVDVAALATHGPAPKSRQLGGVSLARGQVRRFAIGLGGAAVELSELP